MKFKIDELILNKVLYKKIKKILDNCLPSTAPLINKLIFLGSAEGELSYTKKIF